MQPLQPYSRYLKLVRLRRFDVIKILVATSSVDVAVQSVISYPTVTLEVSVATESM